MRYASLSIVVILATLACAGCKTVREVEFDARKPSIEITSEGAVKFGGQVVDPQEVPDMLEAYDVPHDRPIHILLSPEYRDLSGPRLFMGLLAKNGYTRSVLVYKRHAESSAHDIETPGISAGPRKGTVKPFRMKKANE